MMEKILGNAEKLSNRLKEHNGSTDSLVELMTTLNKKIDSMKTFQDNLPDLTEMALCKSRCTVKLGLSQENSQIRELEQENKELKQSLGEHELALDLIMSKYRQQVTKLLGSNQVNKSILHKETVQSQELQDKEEKINEMGKVMWKAIGDDDQSTYDSQQLLTQLRIENNGIRELLFIACNSGNPLKAVNQHTQTDAIVCLPRHSYRASGLSFTSESTKGDAESEFSGATPRNSRPDYSLSSAVSGRGNDTCLDTTAVQSPREFRNTKASSDLPYDGFASPQNRGTRAASEIDGPSFSSARRDERAESALDDVVLADVVTSPSRSIEQMPTEDERTIDSKLPSSPVDHATVVNHVCDNPTPNCLEEPNHSQIDGNLPSASFSVTSNCSSTDAERTSQVSSSPAVNTATTAAAVSAPPPKQHVAGKTQVNETPAHLKGTTGNKNITAATSSRNRGSPKATSSPSHGAMQRNVSTPSTGGTPSRLKYGGTASTIPHPKTTPPGKVSAANKTASAVTGGKNSPSTSPSIHAGKTATAGHVVKATPTRIIETTAAAKQQSLFSVLGTASAASLHSNVTASSRAAALDSNGNNSQSPVPSEISNANRRCPDGQ